MSDVGQRSGWRKDRSGRHSAKLEQTRGLTDIERAVARNALARLAGNGIVPVIERSICPTE